MNKYYYCIVIFLLSPLTLTSCSTTPTEEEDTIIFGEEPVGPGLLTGETGESVLFGGNNIKSKKDAAALDNNTSTIGFSQNEAEEFAAFKRWEKAKQSRGRNYEEFLLWMKFERYKQRQSSTN